MSKNVIVTGASGGIGREIALSLAKAGYSLTICYNKNEQSAKELFALCSESGAECLCVQCDLSNSESVSNMVKASVDTFGSIYGLVNNAGISHWGLFTDMTEEQWDEIFSVNVKSMFLTCKMVLPYMLRSKEGSIVNISSMWGQVGASCEVVYSATKGAIISMTKALAKEEAPSGIRVNCVAPGLIETPMNSRFSPEELDAVTEEIPLGRMGTPSEIASAVKFFLSPEASYITGQVLGVNGGMIM